MNPLVNYLAAFLLVVAGACVRTRGVRQLLLLLGSYVFYAAWGLPFLAVLIASSVMNFCLASLLKRRPTLGRLIVGVVMNVALLGFFKYLPAFASKGSADFLHRIVMPVGMSFWTFQALSYLFDTYHEDDADPSLLEFCLYLSFWPTVLTGPVCRLPKMLPQFREVHGFSSTNFIAGMRRIGAGMIMKMILAQFLGTALGTATDLQGNASAWSGMDVWFIAIGYGFQLFFDFAGYSQIVIGAALLFGFSLEENFDSPYLSSTPSIFWTRWHMSLSSWIRDYVFVPMATLRRGFAWRCFALGFSMVLFGVWHGATLTFLLWGTYHGLLLVGHRIIQQTRQRFGMTMDGAGWSFLSWVVTFFGISLGWVLFRTSDVNQAGVMFHAVLSPSGYLQLALPRDYYRVVLMVVLGYFAYSGITSDVINEKWQEFLTRESDRPGVARGVLKYSWENRWWWLTPMIATVVIFAEFALLSQSAHVAPFIYTLF